MAHAVSKIILNTLIFTVNNNIIILIKSVMGCLKGCRIIFNLQVCIRKRNARFPCFPWDSRGNGDGKNMYFENMNGSGNCNVGMGWNGSQQM